jgi:hypothetical protein
MLQADKQVLLAGVKRSALELRQKELDFNVERYTNLATQASVIAGFSFESLVELEVPEGTAWWLAGLYFIFGSSAMALALYCLVVASFACVFGHRLALQGPHGSLEIAVSILIAHRQHIFSVGGLSLLCLVIAAVLMAWIKMGAAAGVVTLIFLLFAAATFHRMVHMARVFEIKDIDLVTGAVRIADPSSRGAGVDLARLNPGSRKVTPAPAPPAVPQRDRYQPLLDEEEMPRAAKPNNVFKRPSWLGGAPEKSEAACSSAASNPSSASPMPGLPPGGDAAAFQTTQVASAMITHEGHLYKKGDGASALGTGNVFRRRYFVLKDGKLFYYKTWEDYGSGGKATNLKEPIEMHRYEPKILDSNDGPNRFDLVPTENPLERKWELQAATPADLADWIDALQQTRTAALARLGLSAGRSLEEPVMRSGPTE